MDVTLPDYESLTAAIRSLAGRLGAGRRGERLAAYALAAPDLVVFASRVLLDERVPRALRGEIVASLIYIASPFDLIPESLFGPFGLVDDAVVASRLFDALLNRVDPAVARELWPGDRAVFDTLQGVAAGARRIFKHGLRDGARLLAREGLRAAARALRAAIPDGLALSSHPG